MVGLEVALSGGGGSQWPVWGWVSVARLGVGLSARVGMGLSVWGGGGSQWQGWGGSQWPGWGWVSVVGMGWVSVVGMGWVSVVRVGVGLPKQGRDGVGLGQDGEGLSRRDGVGFLYI